MTTWIIYAAAAFCEIAGCFSFWAWLRMGKPVWVVLPGMAVLAAFAWLLTLVPADAAGRAYAAYGGIYILASLAWLYAVEGRVPDRFDLAGGALSIAGTALILFGPRG